VGVTVVTVVETGKAEDLTVAVERQQGEGSDFYEIFEPPVSTRLEYMRRNCLKNNSI
jgi:hypothetical protein